ncbi:hypothetical protein [Gilliamella apicola]|uniref:Uncharacterized protein n=1 Tax=Gilliamella apicola TaxID=1196095 RepID=A0A2V4E0E6_9GAMM|nr:hypothetical protein [Gilliamella apicola]PXZ04336.1 hypothetical protein DKK79_08225 [Gilliamella apicola]
MENDLIISLKGFGDENTANLIGNFTSTVIKELEKEYKLNISKLKKILITYDFETALDEIAKEYGYESSSYTNNEHVTAIAQLQPKLDNTGLYSEFTLVLNITFFYELFNKDGSISFDNISNIIHMMHHELIHVHEKNECKFDAGKLVDEYDNSILMTSIKSWSEFLANHMSSKTATPELIKKDLYNLETALIEVPKEIEFFVKKYKTGILSLDDMHFNVTQRIKLITSLYGYAFGYISAIEISPELYSSSLLDLLKTTKLSSLLKDLGKCFLELTNLFNQGELSDYNMFENANKTVLSIYELFGLSLERQDKGLYVHVD